METPSALALQPFQQNNYISRMNVFGWLILPLTMSAVAVAVAVAYDYVLTFPNEIDYVWTQPWTSVSFLYILIRYLGCYFAIVESLSGTSFVPGPVEVGYAIYVLNRFSFLIFFTAAETLMILRAWAMFNRSKLILSILLTIFVLDILLSIATTIFASIPKNAKIFIVEMPNFSYCSESGSAKFYNWAQEIIILQFIPSAATCILVVVQFIRQSIQMYQATKQWQLNKYMNLLVKEGIIYFLVILVFGLVNLQSRYFGLTDNGTMFAACYLPIFTLTPRFILGIRALYARDVQRKGSSGIDTGFGLSSSSDPDTMIAFANVDVGQDEESERDEEVVSMDAEGIRHSRNRCAGNHDE